MAEEVGRPIALPVPNDGEPIDPDGELLAPMEAPEDFHDSEEELVEPVQSAVSIGTQLIQMVKKVEDLSAKNDDQEKRSKTELENLRQNLGQKNIQLESKVLKYETSAKNAGEIIKSTEKVSELHAKMFEELSKHSEEKNKKAKEESEKVINLCRELEGKMEKLSKITHTKFEQQTDDNKTT